MTAVSPAKVIAKVAEGSFVRVSDLPGTPNAARQAAARAAKRRELVWIRRGLYYRGVKTRYGMTKPRIEEIAREVLGEVGCGPASYSAARSWVVTTQLPASFHVATLFPTSPIEGITQHARSNRARVDLTYLEIALLELLRNPETFIEAGWPAFVDRVREAVSKGEVQLARVESTVATERNRAVARNYDRLIADL